MNRLKALFLLDADAYGLVYAPAATAELSKRVHVNGAPMTKRSIVANRSLLADVDVIFSGWGMPKVDEAFVDAAPNLKAIFYAAGAIGGWATPAVWERDILVTTANHANAIPVADYTVATALFSLKHGWRLLRNTADRKFQVRPELPGNYKSVIGLVGMGTIARLVVERLRPFGIKILTFDPFLSDCEADILGVEKVDLQTLFAEACVVSLHAPDLPSTDGMITGDLLASMKVGATFINTARGKLVRESEMIAVLRDRPDLQAVLDVTEHEERAASSPLNAMDNVVLTPHIAGSQGRECQRMGQYMVDELDRYLAGRPLKWQVRPTALANSVHQLAAAINRPADRPVDRPADRAAVGMKITA